ncbi:uncharacterized protein LOC112690710 [Sipha flava]|uniref:Uncharacterized protein LOC112690710 n=1 Tax=Sipha flava TaxID=143950 RepID=A0A8B8GCZ1_9HEMI|nr:uncharacterized protein LOC112690710 [Sipha flava]
MSEIPHSSKSLPEKNQVMEDSQMINHQEPLNPPEQPPELDATKKHQQITLLLKYAMSSSVKSIHVSVIQQTPVTEELPTAKPTQLKKSMDSISSEITNTCICDPDVIIIDDSDDSLDLNLNNTTSATDFPPDSSIVGRGVRTTEIMDYGDRERDRITYREHQYPNVHPNELQPSHMLVPLVNEEYEQFIDPPYTPFNNSQCLIQPNNSFNYSNFSSIGISLNANTTSTFEQQPEGNNNLEHNSNSDNARPLMNQSYNDSQGMSSRNYSLQDHETAHILATLSKVKKPRKKYKKRTGTELTRSVNPASEQNEAKLNNSEFSCNLCPKQFKSKRALSQHTRFHKKNEHRP